MYGRVIIGDDDKKNVLDINGGYNDNNRSVIMYEHHGQTNQEWRIIPVADIEEPYFKPTVDEFTATGFKLLQDVDLKDKPFSYSYEVKEFMLGDDLKDKEEIDEVLMTVDGVAEGGENGLALGRMILFK